MCLRHTFTLTAKGDRWQWAFGDGGTSTAQHPVYTYTRPESIP